MTQDAFTEKAKIWDQTPGRVRMADEFAAELEKLVEFTPRTVALEFGCGTGLVGLRFASRVGTLFMLDTSESMLSVLKEKLSNGDPGNVHVSSAPLPEITFGPDGLDVIFTSMALHHIEDLPGVFDQMRDALKPGGKLIIGDLLAEDGSFHADQVVPHNGFDPARLAAILEAGGFKALRHYENGAINKPGKDGAMRSYGKFVLAAEKP